jgi:uncharacterized glyoxalase superfamily protein PhnB
MADPRPRQMPWLTPYLTVRNADKTLVFYQKALGFKTMGAMREKGKVQHASMSYKGKCVVMFAPEGAFGGTDKAPKTLKISAPEMFYLYVDDVDAAHQQAVKAGAKSLSKPADQFWGDRFAQVSDIDGYKWGFAKKLAKRPPKK